MSLYDDRAREISLAWFDKANGTRTLGDSQKHLAFIIAAAMEETSAPLRAHWVAAERECATLRARIEAALRYIDDEHYGLAMRALRGEEGGK